MNPICMASLGTLCQNLAKPGVLSCHSDNPKQNNKINHPEPPAPCSCWELSLIGIIFCGHRCFVPAQAGKKALRGLRIEILSARERAISVAFFII